MKKVAASSMLSISPQTALESAILELKAAEERKSELSAMLVVSSGRIEELSMQLEETRIEANERTAEIQAIRSSLAWRITAPLRNLSRNHEWIGKGLRIMRGISSKNKIGGREQDQVSSPDCNSLGQAAESAGEQVDLTPGTQGCLTLKDSVAIAIPFQWHEPSLIKAPRVVALVRVKCADAVCDFRRYLELIQEPVDLRIVATDHIPAHLLESEFGHWDRGTVDIQVVDDSLRFSHSPLKDFLEGQPTHQYMLYLSDDQEIASTTFEPWRQFMLESAIGSGDSASSILALLDFAPEIGVIGIKHFELIKFQLTSHAQIQRCRQLAIATGFLTEPATAIDFASGSVFWARPAALKSLVTALNRKGVDDNLLSRNEIDLESDALKLVFFACEDAGYQWLNVANPAYYRDASRIHEVASKSILRQQISLCTLPLSCPDDVCTRTEMVEVTARATDALVRDIQRSALGNGQRTSSGQPSVENVAIGLSDEGFSRRNFRTALRAVSIALSRDKKMFDGKIYLASEPDFLIFEPLAASLVHTLEVGPGINPVAFHNRLMSHAFANGATQYICSSSLGVLDPDAIQSLVEMMKANQDKALVSCLDFPIQNERQHSVYSFDTDRLSNDCWMISKAAFDMLGELDEELCASLSFLDLSWRARAMGLSLKINPKALCLNMVTDRRFDDVARREIFISTMRLSRKWEASTQFNEWLAKRAGLQGEGMLPFPIQKVPLAWRSRADFDSHRARAYFSHLLDA